MFIFFNCVTTNNKDIPSKLVLIKLDVKKIFTTKFPTTNSVNTISIKVSF